MADDAAGEAVRRPDAAPSSGDTGFSLPAELMMSLKLSDSGPDHNPHSGEVQFAETIDHLVYDREQNGAVVRAAGSSPLNHAEQLNGAETKAWIASTTISDQHCAAGCGPAEQGGCSRARRAADDAPPRVI